MILKVLVGTLTTGPQVGGIDAYLFTMLELIKKQSPFIQVDFTTTTRNASLEKKLHKYGARLFSVGSLKHPLKQYKKIKNIIKKYSYDVAYMNVSSAINFIGTLAAASEHVNCRIVHAHASGYESNSILASRFIYLLNSICKPLIYYITTDYWACSKQAAKWVFPKKVLCSRSFKVIPNAINVKKYSYNENIRQAIREEYQLNHCLVLGHVGRFSRVKNHKFIIDLFNVIQQINVNSKLLLIGDGELKQSIREYVIKKKLQSSVLFLGNRNDVPDLLQAMDAFIFPSFFEGFGYAVLEAESTGLKCFLSDTVPREVDVTGNCLFLNIKGKSAPNDWAELILSYATDYNREDKSGDLITHGYGLNSINISQLLINVKEQL